MLDEYRRIRRWQERASHVVRAIRAARTSEEAFQLGVLALGDRSNVVRYWACGLLAYSLREDALPHLQPLLQHKDQRTVEDARAAIDAIRSRNHNYFRDRQHTDRITWEVIDSDAIS
jgi:hypothetical protein